MELRSFFHLCIYFCLIMLIFTISINFVSGLGIFPTSYETGIVEGDTANETFEDITDIEEKEGKLGIDALLLGVLGGAGIGAIILAWVTRSPVVLGVYAFSAVFWASYIRTLVVLDLDIFGSLGGFIAIGTTAMFFIFAGAIAGMLSGSG